MATRMSCSAESSSGYRPASSWRHTWRSASMAAAPRALRPVAYDAWATI